MDTSRRTTLLLSVLSSAAFWLLVDAPSRLSAEKARAEGDIPWPTDLEVIPWWKLLLLLGISALVIYATACAVRFVGRSPRQRLLLWPLALAVTWAGWLQGEVALWAYVSPLSTDAYQPLRFERSRLAGSAWTEIVHGGCNSITKDVITFESETHATRHQQGMLIGRFMTLYLILDVWPHGERTALGEVRDGVITWRDEDGYLFQERLTLANGELTLGWVD